MTILYHMDVETALQFWEIVKEMGAETEEQRNEILRIMAQEGFNISISQTSRTPEKIAEDYSRHGHVLYVRGFENGQIT